MGETSDTLLINRQIAMESLAQFSLTKISKYTNRPMQVELLKWRIDHTMKRGINEYKYNIRSKQVVSQEDERNFVAKIAGYITENRDK